MGYSIGEISKLINITAHTLRYYEKEGLISIKRKENGLREFSENDIEILRVIQCLKETSMSIADIKKYIQLCQKGSDTTKERKEIFVMQKKHIEKEIEKLNEYLEVANYKIWYYENLHKYGNDDGIAECKNMREIYKREFGK